MNRFIPTDVPTTERASLLRFWMTPSRPRICTCACTTSNLAKHLIFDCPKTRDLMAHYILELSPELWPPLIPQRFVCSSAGLPALLTSWKASTELSASFSIRYSSNHHLWTYTSNATNKHYRRPISALQITAHKYLAVQRYPVWRMISLTLLYHFCKPASDSLHLFDSSSQLFFF